MKKAVFFLIICLGIADFSFSQSPVSTGSIPAGSSLARLQNGIDLFGKGNWQESITELRLVLEETNSRTQSGEALFWLAMARLSAGDNEGAMQDMESLENLYPENRRIAELAYHKGRVFFNLGRYDDAIVIFRQYADSLGSGELSSQDKSKKASSYFWIGECLFALGHLERAEEVFLYVETEFPQSSKYEASSYRVALIGQKKIEAELLDLLRWNHEESLKIMDEYQRRERAYDQAILSYQKRIDDMLKDTRLAELEAANAQYRQQLALAEDRIRVLELNLGEALGIAMGLRYSPPDSSSRLRELKTSAVEVRDEMERILGNVRGSER